ncbi:MAG: magnesium transporter [bacterium]|nr:magnesium transporter [bacterium]
MSDGYSTHTTATERRIRELLEAQQLNELRALVNDEYAPDLADVLERLDEDEQLKVFGLLEIDMAIDVLHELGRQATRHILSGIPAARVGDLLDEMPMDDAASILIEDVPDMQEEFLAEMEPADAAEVRDLLQYPPKSAGRLMTEKFARIRPEATVQDVMAHLRKIDPEVETISDVYALDPQGRLAGVASLRQLVTADPQQRIREIMATDLITVAPDTDQEDVARLVARYDFLAIPVVTSDLRMLGIITVDDVIHVLVEESAEDALRFGGVEGAVGLISQPYFTVPLNKVIRSRLGWLLLLFVAETFTGMVLRGYESQLAQVTALSFFIPLLIGTGGNTGAQTVSTIIRALALKEVRLSDGMRVLAREMGSGLLLGTLLGTVGFFRALLWGSGFGLSLVVGLSVLAICAWANTIGSLIPLIATRFKIDPAIVSAPLITTLVGATGLAIYLTIATIILRL